MCLMSHLTDNFQYHAFMVGLLTLKISLLRSMEKGMNYQKKKKKENL
jgi:hypothetical protein